jgi:O-acetyl-ADP-ribose deacetylase (regulator of RNase III)
VTEKFSQENKMLKILKDTDITTCTADIIVNSSNQRLMMGRGVCGAIFRKAGRIKLARACKKYKRPIPLGTAVITPAFKLNAKYIIHTASMRYLDGSHGECDILKKCYQNCLKLAIENNCKSIVFPLIGSGIYGFPKEKALNIATTAIEGFFSTYSVDLDVSLIVFEDVRK